ncbi:MAG: NYN domain-containing protein [Prochloraceae cyanobacterium]
MSSLPFQAQLLIDGYNIIGAWPELKRTRDRHGLESARRELIEIAIDYSASQGYQTQIVFDAHYQKTPSSQEKYTANLLAHYTAFAQTADSYIEKFCASHFRRYQPSSNRLIVATSDRAQQLTVVGYGAEWLSAQKLAKDVESTARRRKRKHRPQKQARGRFLSNSLDPKSREILSQWRHNIKS